MGFFSKIFRRKPSETTATNKKRGVRRGRRNNKFSNNTHPEDDRDDSPTDTAMEEPAVNSRAFVPIAAHRGPDLSDGSQRLVLHPRISPREYAGGPVDLDDLEASTLGEEETTNLQPPPTHHQHPALRLSSERLAEFTQQQQQQPKQSPRSQSSSPMFTMDSEPITKNNSKKLFTAGHIAIATDEHSESSSFNLSTDAEDTEYEDLKKHGIVRKNTKATLSGDASSQVSSPSNYQTDGEGTVFPNLLTDDEGNSVRSGPSLLLQSSTERPSFDKAPTGRSPPGVLAWGGSKDATSPISTGANGSRREMTSPKATQDEFANFADFSSFAGDAFFPKPTSPIVEEEESGPSHKVPHRSHSFTRSTPSVASDTSLSELLAQAKSKKLSNRSQRSGGSVNSAPAMTAAQLRVFHGLKPRSSEHDGTSVSDIIKSLEADNANRSRRSTGKRHSDAHSTHSHDVSVRSARERLRRRRESERRRSSPDDASTDSDEDAESWLMDEVTGALGPRGIAADLESLSGRSNRSHKSHRSHHSRKSRHSTRRRNTKASSGESVDSHGSKRSGGSRRSRYSHRSAKSYMSQMSEQSRSVANDLLRLEMQLAMVNPSGVLNPEQSRPSRSRRSGGTVPRRSRISVVAPPGKLGIILANKADSRGTVVSGVRTSSALADRISPGDRIVAIDGEDVSLMTVSEITTIMARKSEYDRTLTVLTTPRSLGSPESATSPRLHRG